MNALRIKRVKLKNFRSYKSVDLTLPSGVVLFEGDIGSGKSSILYAIEFALFGLGELKASHLLRHGADKASVEVALEVNGAEVIVNRGIERRSSRVTQARRGTITIDGVETPYSPSEMKPAILKILGFNEPPDPKSTSVIYRYAVFTPQEEMKFVLNRRPDERLQTLRKVFGVEEYKRARDNAKTYSSFLKKRCEYLKGSTRDLEKLGDETTSLENGLKEVRGILASTQQKKELLNKALNEAKQREAKADEARSRATELKAEAASLQTMLERLKQVIQARRKELDEAKQRAEQGLTEPRKPVREAGAVSEELREARVKASGARGKEAVARAEAKRARKLVEKGRCPTCGQEIGVKVREHAVKGGEEAERLLKALRKLDARVNALEKELEAARKAGQARKEYWLHKKLADEARKKAIELTGLLRVVEEEALNTEKELTEKKARLKKLSGAIEEWSAARKRREEAGLQLRRVEQREAGARAVLENKEAELEQKREALRRARVEKAELERLQERVEWLDQRFIPVLENVEEEVFAVINRDFDCEFRKWVNVLLEGTELDARVDASLSPQVTQDGYEQDVNALSGGEKTAIALAYRLALNELTRREYASLKENLLILDEPTDGFSKEQLYKMRAVFDSIKGQVIVVSHERELEAFADKVFHVQKDGESKVVA